MARLTLIAALLLAAGCTPTSLLPTWEPNTSLQPPSSRYHASPEALGVHVTRFGPRYGYDPLFVPLEPFIEMAYLPMVLPQGHVDFLDTGSGFGLKLGAFGDPTYDAMETRIGLEAGFESSWHENPATGGEATHTRLLLGMRLQDEYMLPVYYWLSVGVAWHLLAFENVSPDEDIGGWGMYAGAGMAYQVIEGFSIGVKGDYHYWAGVNDFDEETTQGLVQLAAMLTVNF